MLKLCRSHIQTPLGPMLALASPDGLCVLEFSTQPRTLRLDAWLRRWFPALEIVERSMPVLERTCDWLAMYFNGENAEVGDLPVDLRGAPFERRVWAALREIPPGMTTTYGAIAKKLDAPDASRAVGAANGANPVSIIVPCHRVIGSSGALTGYGGGLHRKSWLLAHEARWRNDSQGDLFQIAPSSPPIPTTPSMTMLGSVARSHVRSLATGPRELERRVKTSHVMDDDQRRLRDDKLDEALEETFPASDPPANTVETGIGIADAMISDDAPELG